MSFQWLNQLMEWFGKWIPRLVLIDATHVGVKFGLRGSVSTMLPGLYCYWPITTNVRQVSTRCRTIELATQLHGGEVVSLVIAFRIADA